MHPVGTQLSRTLTDPAYADLPEPCRKIIRASIVLADVVPYASLTVLWFSVVWAVNELQLLTGHVLWGAPHALLDLIKLGISSVALLMLYVMHITRSEWIRLAHQTIYDGLEECLRPWVK